MKTTLTFCLFLLVFHSAYSQRVLYSNNFDNGAGGWTTPNDPNSVGWKWGNRDSIVSAGMSFTGNTTYFFGTNDFKYDDATTLRNRAYADSLISSPINLKIANAQRTLQVSFNTYHKQYTATNRSSKCLFLVSYDRKATWVLIDTLTNRNYVWDSTLTYDLTAMSQLKSQDSVYFAFVFNDLNHWAYAWAIDDFKLTEGNANDASITFTNNYQYVPTSADSVFLVFKLTSYCTQNLTTIDLNFLYNGQLQTRTLTGLNLAYGASKWITTKMPAAISSAEVRYGKIWITNPNGLPDDTPNAQDTSRVFHFFGLDSVVKYNPFNEHFTGTWCKYCYSSGVSFNNELAANPNIETAQVHNGDQFSVGALTGIGNIYAYDRLMFPYADIYYAPMLSSPYGHPAYHKNYHKTSAIIDFDYAYARNTRTVTATIKVKFVGVDSGDFRFNVVVMEDKLRADQYKGNGEYAKNFTHNRVVRQWVGGNIWGDTAGIPTKVYPGMEFTKQFVFTLPDEWKISNLSLTGLFQKYGPNGWDKVILNSEWSKFNVYGYTSVENELHTLGTSSFYPNPTSGSATLQLDLTNAVPVNYALMNITGQLIRTTDLGTLPQGEHHLPISMSDTYGQQLPAGIYLLSINAGTTRLTHKVIVVD